MPSADAILAGLTEAANTWRWLAILWHVFLSAVFVAFLAGAQLSTRLVALVAVVLVASVSAVGLVTGNPFNATVFAGLAILLLVAAIRVHSSSVHLAAPRWAIAGAGLVLFGITYPHFVATASWTEYAYAAPVGLIPCPTLAVVIGFTLMFRNFGAAGWTVPLIFAGLLYGTVGVLGLGVGLDVVLLAGSLVLGVASATSVDDPIDLRDRQRPAA